MAIAKSAYDLACERIIVSKYGDQLAREKKDLKRKEKERISSLPDFVADWEIKNNDLSDSNDIEEEKIMPKASSEPTKIFTPEEIRKHRERNNKVEIEETEEVEEASANEPQGQEEQEQGESNISVPEVHWYGHFTSYGGFSRQNRAFVFGLSNRGVRVKIDMQPLAIDVNSATMKELEFLAKLDVNPKAPKIYSATIPLDMNHNGKKIIYTMMESESLHKNYVDKVNLFDEVWVPTHFAQKQFKKYGVHRQTHVMPLGVDTERYFPTEKVNPASLGFDLNKFVFLSVFKWGYRKGFDILLKAYFDEFSSKDDVSLLLITRCETDNNPERIPNDISNLRAGIDKSDDELPHLVVHTKNVQEKNLPKIYSMSDAFVLPSLGEGFGLIFLEAAACGLPVIASNCSGHSDFLKKENSFLIDPDEMSEVKANGNMSKLAKHCGFYEGQVFPNFGSTGIKKLGKLMREVYENYEDALNKAQLLTDLVHDEYSWDMAVDRVLKRIKEIV